MNVGGSDVTLVEEIVRDGCYVTDFALDHDELATLLTGVDDLSFVDLLDVGPGTGFGTTEPTPHPPTEEYIPLVSELVSDTGLTTLLLPSVASESEVSLLASYEDVFDLIRVGVDVDDARAARPLLDTLDALDVETSLNLLKTYLVDPEVAAEAAQFGVEHGADVVYVVDSAGGFTPSEVCRYVETVGAAVDVETGFHGHDNVGFGLQNALAAIDAGASYVDASLQGIGRSAGNTQTELLCGRFPEDVTTGDWRQLRDLEGRIGDIYPGRGGVAVEDVLYGLAGFHSSFEGDLRSFAAAHDERFIDILVLAASHELSTMAEIREAYASVRRPTAD